MPSGFEEVQKYEHTQPAPRWRYGPREATGTLVNSICVSLGSAIAYGLEQYVDHSTPVFGSVAEHPIAATAGFTIGLRMLAYFFRNGGSSVIGDIITSIWVKFKGKKNDG